MRGGIKTILSPDTLASSQYSKTNNVANRRTKILDITVPRGMAVLPDLTRLPATLVGYVEVIECAGDHALFNTTYPPARITGLTGVAVADGEHARVALSADGTARTITEITDHIDGPAQGKIKCSDETNANHQVSYVPWADGILELVIEAPDGSGSSERQVFRGNTKYLHALNQMRDGRPINWGAPIPENFRFVWYLTSAWVNAWTDGATGSPATLDFSRLEIPCEMVPLQLVTQRGDAYLGETAEKMARAWIAGG